MIGFAPGFRKTDDGEIWATETERENDVWAVYQNTFSADTYFILIGLNNSNFPHLIQGQPSDRIDLTSIYYSLDVAINTTATILYGVICRIDDTDADIEYFSSIPFVIGATQQDQVVALRAVPSQVKLDLIGCTPQHGITNINERNVAAVNTGLTLDSPAGAITPGLGDLIVKYDHAAGSALFGTFVFYHTH
jgi:hypothetical protein